MVVVVVVVRSVKIPSSLASFKSRLVFLSGKEAVIPVVAAAVVLRFGAIQIMTAISYVKYF